MPSSSGGLLTVDKASNILRIVLISLQFITGHQSQQGGMVVFVAGLPAGGIS